MNLDRAATMTAELLRVHNLNDWRLAFNRRKTALGLCRYEQRRIELSCYFVIAHDEGEVRDVILHEIAHALAGSAAGHGPRWKAICRRIGARPERCGQAKMPTGRWAALCPSCRREFRRHRRPKRGWRYACGSCGPTDGHLAFRRSA